MQNDTLMTQFGTTDVVVPESGIVLWNGVNVTVPYCSLEKELDNVSNRFLGHILYPYADKTLYLIWSFSSVNIL